MADELPYRSEYAKSARSSCKGCKGNIAKDNLRLAIMLPGFKAGEKQPSWYHFNCFFEKQKPKSVKDISDFDSLKADDQKRIKEQVDLKNSIGTTDEELKNFCTEYAKSAKSTCRACQQKIDKGVVRISKLDHETGFSKLHGPHPVWYHVDCFVKNRDDLDYTRAAEELPGFDTLSSEDQKELKEKLKKQERKRKSDVADNDQGSKKQKKEEEEEEEQDSEEESESESDDL